MDPHAQPVTVRRIDYAHAFRFTRLFDGFRIAIHPSRMLLALLLILCVYLGGRMLDVMFGKQVLPGEFGQYVASTPEAFESWYERHAPGPNVTPENDRREGVFDSALTVKLALFESMIRSAMSLDIGIDHLYPSARIDRPTVIGSLRTIALVPLWLWDHHLGFFLAYLAMFTLFWGLLGGALARSVMVEAASGRIPAATRCVQFAWRRYGWFIVTPLLPLILVLGFSLLLIVGGFLFNFPVTDILAALLFIGALAIGFVMAVLLIGWFGGVHLMYPALAAEGTDAFDAAARACGYFFAQPWRLAWYSLIALMYGAVTYLVVGLFIFVTVAVTHQAVGVTNWRLAGPVPAVQPDTPAPATEPGPPIDATPAATASAAPETPSDGLTRFEAMFPDPVFGRVAADPQTERLNWSGKVASTLLLMWHYLLLGLVAAYVISYYHAAYAIIYLLLRRCTDGTDPAVLFDEPEPVRPAPQDKVEPAPTAPAPPAAPAPAPPPTPPAASAPDKSDTPDESNPDT